MLRKFVGVMVLLVGAGLVLADEAKGKFKKAEKGTVTVTVGDKDVEYKLGKDAKVFDGDTEIKGKERGKFFKDLKEGSDVTVVYDKDGDKITVKEFRKK